MQPQRLDRAIAQMSGIGMEAVVIEYRNGNSKDNTVMKLTGCSCLRVKSTARRIIFVLNAPARPRSDERSRR